MKKMILTCAICLCALAPEGYSVQAAMGKTTTRKIEIHAKRYAFVPNEVTLQKGQTTILDLISDDVPHSLVIEGLNVHVKMLGSEPVEATITPEQVGDFQGACGVFCGSGHGKMVFRVHVVDAQ